MQNWTKLFAQVLLVALVLILAAIVSRAVYLRVDRPSSDEVQQENETSRDVADCRVQHREDGHSGQHSQDESIWMASCLDS